MWPVDLVGPVLAALAEFLLTVSVLVVSMFSTIVLAASILVVLVWIRPLLAPFISFESVLAESSLLMYAGNEAEEQVLQSILKICYM